MSDAEPKPQQWHLDRNVPIAIIVTVIIQTATIVWYASKLDSRVTLLENRTESFWRERDSTRDRLLTLEQQSKSIYEATKRIELRLEPPVRRLEVQ